MRQVAIRTHEHRIEVGEQPDISAVRQVNTRQLDTSDGASVRSFFFIRRKLQPDPTPIALHAERVVAPWDPRSISWASQPRSEDMRAPATRVIPGGRHLVRIDVRNIVRNWYLRDERDQGIVIVAENSTDVGMAFALSSPEVSIEGSNLETSDRDGPMFSSPPRLELYIKPEGSTNR